jgi:hypothetical protein
MTREKKFAEGKIEVGQIWEVVSDCFFTSDKKSEYNRPIKLAKGEKIEIRFPYEWHFRTEDNFYFHAFPEMIFENCKPFGVIMPDVRFNNKANLEEILRLKLYHEAKAYGEKP